MANNVRISYKYISLEVWDDRPMNVGCGVKVGSRGEKRSKEEMYILNTMPPGGSSSCCFESALLSRLLDCIPDSNRIPCIGNKLEAVLVFGKLMCRQTGWMDRRMEGRTDGWMNVRMDRWMGGQMDVRKNGWMNK